MNRNLSPRFAAYLLDEIGQIEDRYLAEAQAPCRVTRRTLLPRRALIVALSLALTLTLLLSALLIGSWQGAKSEDIALNDEDGAEPEQVFDQFSGATAKTLSSRFSEIRGSTESLKTPEERIDLFDGQAKVIWKYTEEETYRVRTLSAAEYTQLTQTLHTEKSTEAPASEEQSLAGVWLAAGDGTVISPQLEQTSENVGYGALFAYRPEREPSAVFTELLFAMLS